jgi:hypothetical protein
LYFGWCGASTRAQMRLAVPARPAAIQNRESRRRSHSRSRNVPLTTALSSFSLTLLYYVLCSTLLRRTQRRQGLMLHRRAAQSSLTGGGTMNVHIAGGIG